MSLDTCPKCKGTGRIPPTDVVRQWLPNIASYREEDDTLACDNCGGQTMTMSALGVTRVDPATGTGCLHSYTGRLAGNCYRIFTCTKCGDKYDIDSGD